MSVDPKTLDLTRTALILGDLQNDFIHPDGAYGRSGTTDPDIAAVPGRVAPVAKAMRAADGCGKSSAAGGFPRPIRAASSWLNSWSSGSTHCSRPLSPYPSL